MIELACWIVEIIWDGSIEASEYVLCGHIYGFGLLRTSNTIQRVLKISK